MNSICMPSTSSITIASQTAELTWPVDLPVSHLSVDGRGKREVYFGNAVPFSFGDEVSIKAYDASGIAIAFYIGQLSPMDVELQPLLLVECSSKIHCVEGFIFDGENRVAHAVTKRNEKGEFLLSLDLKAGAFYLLAFFTEEGELLGQQEGDVSTLTKAGYIASF